MKLILVVLVGLLLARGVMAMGNDSEDGQLDRDPAGQLFYTSEAASSNLCKDGTGCDSECRTLVLISYDFHQLIKTPEFDLVVAKKQNDSGDVAVGNEILTFDYFVDNITKMADDENKDGLMEILNGTDRLTPGQAYCKSGRCMWARIPNFHVGPQDSDNSTQDPGNSTEDNQVFWEALGGICASEGFVEPIAREGEPLPDIDVDKKAPPAPPKVEVESSGKQMKATWTFGILLVLIAFTMY